VFGIQFSIYELSQKRIRSGKRKGMKIENRKIEIKEKRVCDSFGTRTLTKMFFVLLGKTFLFFHATESTAKIPTWKCFAAGKLEFFILLSGKSMPV
jgi:hypothetical protein